jgi:hypothetical protein
MTQHMVTPDASLTPMRRRYSINHVVTIEEWGMRAALVLDAFNRKVDADCAVKGYPLPPGGTVGQVTGLRLNTEQAQDDRGQTPKWVTCDKNDSRAIEIELRMSWEN